MTVQNRGYTLIEILIVLFIISIVTTVGLLTIGFNGNKEIERFTQEVIEIINLAEEQAMLSPAVLGMTWTENSLQFTNLQKNGWQPVEDKLLSPHSIPNNVEMVIEVNKTRQINTTQPQIVISTNGDVTPFTIYVGKKGEKPRYAIRGEADGNITSQFLA